MKKILLIIRKGFDADYICSNLPHGYDFTVIFETGRTARKNKLKNMFKRKRNVMLTLADLAALFVYDAYETAKMKKFCRISGICDFQNRGIIDDVNTPTLKGIVERIQPDLIIIYGMGIVRQTTMASMPADIYNIHSSVLPAYRNVHSDFWAYYNRDCKKIGITIFKLSAGVDMGDIVAQAVCDLPAGSRLYEYKAWNLIQIPVLMSDFLREFFRGSLIYIPQDESEASRYSTPTIGDSYRLMKRESK